MKWIFCWRRRAIASAPEISKPLDYRPPDAPKPPEDPGMGALIPAGNLGGLPALSLPCGFADGLPVAIQLVGNPFSENTLAGRGEGVPGAHGFPPPEAEGLASSGSNELAIA